ncbi:fructosamine kinase family protein [Streptomyces sp. S.PB5]|uniref:fructosamine kinase family protein n=1 Tax=Streptomyces sp. S.PB5 TaxID=3020844 RepID=UPI0025AFFBFB|nr:fructosamine kinase family protein [Streptomyces sp. S.PB5]MDN3029500.1 fructosamine kinase family protein [Streptomyces sp. S.PB5]
MSASVPEEGDGPGAVAARLTGRAVVTRRRLTGAVTEVALDGGSVVVKDAGGAAEARAEAAGMRWLGDAGSVRVPPVHGREGRWLVTGFVPEGRPSAEAAVRFGRELAGMHAAGAAAFGAPPPGGCAQAFIGRAPMRNAQGSNWADWYGTHRVLPYVRQAVDGGVVRAAEAAVFEQVCERMDELAGPAEEPARLHGDLWNGNVLWGADGQVWLIDPAAHGGHRETDLAMLQLFGCPFLAEVLAGYQDAAPLAPGRQQRVGLHQLFPLLVHTVLFGRGYADQALVTARRLLAAH